MVVDTTKSHRYKKSDCTNYGPRITAHHLIPMTGSHPRHWRFRKGHLYLLFHDKRPVKSTPSQAALGSPQVRDPREAPMSKFHTTSSSPHLHRHRPTTPVSHKPSRNSPPSSSNPPPSPRHSSQRPNPSSTPHQSTNPPSPSQNPSRTRRASPLARIRSGSLGGRLLGPACGAVMTRTRT